MVTKTNAPRKATPSSVTSVSDFKKSVNDLLELPSGKTIRCRRTSIQTLMAAGMIPNSLMAIVQSSLAQGQATVDAEMFMGDPEKMREMMELVDIVVAHCVKEPTIHIAPDDESDRDENLLYVDELEDDDRSFIFQYATGGTADVEQFRKETAEQLAGIQPEQVVPVPTKRAVRNRG